MWWLEIRWLDGFNDSRYNNKSINKVEPQPNTEPKESDDKTRHTLWRTESLTLDVLGLDDLWWVEGTKRLDTVEKSQGCLFCIIKSTKENKNSA